MRISAIYRAVRARPHFVLAVLVLAIGMVSAPGVRHFLRGLKSPEWNRADRDKNAAGYYVGLIDGASATDDSLTRLVMGKPPEWVDFKTIGAVEYLPLDPIQFRLRAGISRVAFGKPFTTNELRLRDRPTTAAKPAGVYRIVLLGSSIDMGWGVGDDDTYEHHLEDWLNRVAAERKLERRFEVLNCAMAAYSPLHRLIGYERYGREFEPDLVIYAATMLDPRLLEIHLCGLLQSHVAPPYSFVAETLGQVGLTAGELSVLTAEEGGKGADRKPAIKLKLRPALWTLIEQVVGELSVGARRTGTGLVGLVVPRAGESLSPKDMRRAVGRLREIGARQGVRFIDLTCAFDGLEQSDLAVAPWDDHPNARGHELLFRALARAIESDAGLFERLFYGPISGGTAVVAGRNP